MRPLGVCHLKGKLGAFESFLEVVFPGGKPPTELASLPDIRQRKYILVVG
jgi:hypothetical protein